MSEIKNQKSTTPVAFWQKKIRPENHHMFHGVVHFFLSIPHGQKKNVKISRFKIKMDLKFFFCPHFFFVQFFDFSGSNFFIHFFYCFCSYFFITVFFTHVRMNLISTKINFSTHVTNTFMT